MGTDSAVWRCTTGVVSEVSVAASDLIQFNETPVVSTGQYIHNTEVNWRNSVPENERIAANVNNVQDMGLDGVDYQLTCTFKNSTSTSASHPLAKLRNWMTSPMINSTFLFGRFGVRMDNMPQFNVTPSGAAYGLVLNGIRPINDPARGGSVVGCIINLRFSGDPTGIGA